MTRLQDNLWSLTHDSERSPPGSEDRPLLSIDSLEWFIRLRWVFIAAALALLVIDGMVQSDYERPRQVFLTLALLAAANVAWWNLAQWFRRRAARENDETRARHRVLYFAHGQIALDLFALTVMLRYTGGVESPLAIIYVFHMALGSLLLPRARAVHREQDSPLLRLLKRGATPVIRVSLHPAGLAVILAGVTMNLLFAVVIYAGLFMSAGEPRPAITPLDAVDAGRLPAGAEALGTIQRGDVITHINGDTVRTWDEVQDRVLKSRDTVRVEVAARPEVLVLRFQPDDKASREQALRALRPLIPARIGLVAVGQPASRAKLQLGDVIIRAGGDTVRSWDELVQKIRSSTGQPLRLDVLRGDSVLQVTVTPEAQTQKDSTGREITYGMIGASSDPRGPIVRVRVGFGRAALRLTAFGAVRLAGALRTSLLRAAGRLAGALRRLGLALAFFLVAMRILLV